MSFSTNCSASFCRDGKPFNDVDIASSACEDDKEPGSEALEICFEAGDEPMPRKGREYDLRNEDKSGRDERLGSLESYPSAVYE